MRYAGLAIGSEPALPILVDTSDEIHVQLSKNYINSLIEALEGDYDVAGTCIGSVTIDGQSHNLLPQEFVTVDNTLNGNIQSVNKYLTWSIYGNEPTELVLYPRNDYTIEAIRVVDIYWT